jgi:ABC-2 type transport system ATP-binding protein
MIQIDHLSFGYRKGNPLFNALELSLPAGSVYGLLGRNGAGKSTLLKIISGLLEPLKGTIDFMGYRPHDRQPGFLREIYLIGEEFDLPAMKGSEFVRFYSRFYPRFSLQLFEHCISEFGLPENQKLSQMSYGQKKNFLLAFGLATNCKLLILDEPTNGLDIPSKHLFRKVIANAVHEERSFIISTHQVKDIENLIDVVTILDEGKVIFSSSCEEISGKLTFSRLTKLPPDHSVLYAESSLGGYLIVDHNISDTETRINLELLFNAVIEKRTEINTIFKS